MGVTGQTLSKAMLEWIKDLTRIQMGCNAGHNNVNIKKSVSCFQSLSSTIWRSGVIYGELGLRSEYFMTALFCFILGSILNFCIPPLLIHRPSAGIVGWGL